MAPTPSAAEREVGVQTEVQDSKTSWSPGAVPVFAMVPPGSSITERPPRSTPLIRKGFSLEQTYEDPATFTAPWTSTRTLVRAPNLELLEFGCVLEDAGYEDFNAP